MFDPSAYMRIPGRLEQLGGYMSATSAAVLSCACSAADFERPPTSWQLLGDVVTRYEAEFAGRLLIGPEDFGRWCSEPSDGLTWGMLGVSGLDDLVRDQPDLKRLPALFERGVRVIQLVETANSLLAGSAEPGDDRGLTELGRSCLSEIETLPTNDRRGGRPIVDLAHLNPRSMSDVIETVESSARTGRILLMYSHGAVAHSGFDGPRALDVQNLARLRAAGSLIGLTPARRPTEAPRSSNRPLSRSRRSPSKDDRVMRALRSDAISLTSRRRFPSLAMPRRSSRGLNERSTAMRRQC